MRAVEEIPEQVSPQVFFEELLLEWADELFTPPPLVEEVTFCVEIELQGDQGGVWTLHFDLGDYRVEQGRAENPFLRVRSHIDNWKITFGSWMREIAQQIEDAGGPEDAIEKIMEMERKRGRPEVRLTDKKIEQLTALPTIFEAKADGYKGHDLCVRVALASSLEGSPSFTLETDGPTYEELRKGNLHPLDAWTQKKVSLQGNLALSLKLGKILQK